MLHRCHIYIPTDKEPEGSNPTNCGQPGTWGDYAKDSEATVDNALKDVEEEENCSGSSGDKVIQ